jgi:hypothetical protein
MIYRTSLIDLPVGSVCRSEPVDEGYFGKMIVCQRMSSEAEKCPRCSRHDIYCDLTRGAFVSFERLSV